MARKKTIVRTLDSPKRDTDNLESLLLDLNNSIKKDRPAGAFTTRDLAAKARVTMASAGKIMRRMFDVGLVEFAGSVIVVDMTGVPGNVPSYRKLR